MTRVMLAALLIALLLTAAPTYAEEALVAVAANFVEVARELEREFERDSGYRIELVVGSTGKLYAQIINGAPFDVLLAADQERPRRLEDNGLAVPGSRRTYAVGRLVLWSPDPQRLTGDGAAVLRSGEFRSIAIANPRLAPYGAASLQAFKSMGIYADIRDRIVMGENVGQAHAMVASGNAELGLLALSSITRPDESPAGSRWLVPAALHSPIRQDAVLLERGKKTDAALAFLDFLGGAFAIQIIERFGYKAHRQLAADHRYWAAVGLRRVGFAMPRP